MERRPNLEYDKRIDAAGTVKKVQKYIFWTFKENESKPNMRKMLYSGEHQILSSSIIYVNKNQWLIISKTNLNGCRSK